MRFARWEVDGSKGEEAQEMNKTEMQQFVRKVRGIDADVLDAVRLIKDFQNVEHELAPDKSPTAVQNIAHAFVLLHGMDPTVASQAVAMLLPPAKRAPRKAKVVETPDAPPAPPAPRESIARKVVEPDNAKQPGMAYKGPNDGTNKSALVKNAPKLEDWINNARYEVAEVVQYGAMVYECVIGHVSGDEFDHNLWRGLCSLEKWLDTLEPPSPHQAQPPNATVLPDGGVVTPAPVVSADAVYANAQKDSKPPMLE